MRLHQVDKVGPITTRQVGRVGQNSGVRHHAGQTETHGQRNVFAEEFEEGFGNDRGRSCAGRFGDEVWGSSAGSVDDPPRSIDEYDFDFRTADVNAGGNGGH
jgi:hypothetical protein